MSLKIKEEVKKQFNAGFLAVSHYSEWVTNIVSVPKKDGKFIQWDDNCQVAFERIKWCLMNPPMFVPSVPGRPLIMYMNVLDELMGCALGQHDESRKRERVVYYLSKKFIACEMNYSLLKRTCYALVWAAHHLR
ncbi:uncharacterized protein LOC114397182 [Glycine soja]|uniref:uncharacterized protein LOC114397182 n=1 Tax=Glycine soja TaxID=3848 RepID=UPI00103F6B32|nr:uncharacterized protein LOC114397182 [Glycine soja]